MNLKINYQKLHGGGAVIYAVIQGVCTYQG